MNNIAKDIWEARCIAKLDDPNPELCILMDHETLGALSSNVEFIKDNYSRHFGSNLTIFGIGIIRSIEVNGWELVKIIGKGSKGTYATAQA